MPRKKPQKPKKPEKKKRVRAKGCDPEIVRKTFEEITRARREIKSEDLDGIPRSELESMLVQVTELENRQLYNKIDTYYPDTGPLRRELYRPHLEFFRQGATKRERAIIAANRIGKCLKYETSIDTPDGQVSVGELYERGKPFEVFSWDGEKKVIAQAKAPFKKPQKEPCVRITMSDGSWVETALNHHVLTGHGWRFVSECLPNTGREFFSCSQDSSLEFYPSTLDEDVDHWNQKPLNYPGDYLLSFHQYDEQLPLDEDNDQVSFPLRVGVQLPYDFVCNMDGQGNKHTNNPQLKFAPPSIQDDLNQIVDQSFEFSSPILDNALQSCPVIPPAFGLFSNAGSFELRPVFLDDLYQFSDDALYSPFCVDSNNIISYKSIGVNDVFDFEVEKYHNYIAGGLVHHNSEGIGAYEVALHLTGQYPDWWEGRRFKDPVLAWMAGDTSQTVRDIQQSKLLGPPGLYGTGMIRKDAIAKVNPKAGGVPDAVESILVKHVSGGLSRGVFKSFDQKRKAFQGDEVDVAWLDEECSMAIYGECLIRTMTTNGLVLLTFTPLLGLSEVVMNFMPNGMIPEDQSGSKFIINATWEDAPHLTEQQKQEILDGTPPYLRDARAKGIPQLGAGAIYPILEEDIAVDDFEIPIWYPRAYALDVGWNATAALWGAWNRESDIVYIYSAYKQGQAEPATHVQAINARGTWIPGCADPASRASSQKDGKSLFNEYVDLGLDLSLADNAVEAGIFAVWQRLVSGRLKIFRSLRPFFDEFRLYHRDENGKIVKQNDHLMDCMRYLIMTGMKNAVEKPLEDHPFKYRYGVPNVQGNAAVDRYTGY